MKTSTGRTVLVVNDDADHAQFLSILLQQSGFAPPVAVDGVAGVEKARHHARDVVVCDVMMPTVNLLYHGQREKPKARVA